MDGEATTKTQVIWGAASLPLIGGLVALGICCRSAYLDGLHFVPGLHFFKWLQLLNILGIVSLSGLLVALVAILLARRRLKQSRRMGMALAVAASALIVPLIALPLIERAYEHGRQKAYARLNLQEIFAACVTMRQQFAEHRQPQEILAEDSMYQTLPPAIRTLHPWLAYLHPSAINLQMDGGGPATHEGIAVIWDANLTAMRARTPGMHRLDASLPIYRYALYDFAMVVSGASPVTTAPS